MTNPINEYDPTPPEGEPTPSTLGPVVIGMCVATGVAAFLFAFLVYSGSLPGGLALAAGLGAALHILKGALTVPMPKWLWVLALASPLLVVAGGHYFYFDFNRSATCKFVRSQNKPPYLEMKNLPDNEVLLRYVNHKTKLSCTSPFKAHLEERAATVRAEEKHRLELDRYHANWRNRFFYSMIKDDYWMWAEWVAQAALMPLVAYIALFVPKLKFDFKFMERRA